MILNGSNNKKEDEEIESKDEETIDILEDIDEFLS